MKYYYIFLFIKVVIFNYFINKVIAENSYYIVAIQRNEADKNYYNASEQIQNAIDELVNDRMNDMYDIIDENKETFISENGEMDEKLEELKSFELTKRNIHQKKRKLRFINNNDLLKNKFNKSYDTNSTDDSIPFESVIVSHLCPIYNYFTVKVYLSEKIVHKIEKLKNVLYVEKVFKTQNNSVPYYDIDYIKNETNWTDVSRKRNI